MAHAGREEGTRVIRLQGVEKRYGGATCLRGVSLDFERGKVTALVGPSGSGKSTLLRCINGLEPFDAGVIEVDAHTLRPGHGDTATLLAVRRTVGFVFQHFNLFAHKTALENVMEAPVHVKGVPKDHAHTRARALLDKVKLGHREGAYPHELSGGEQQRVAIARALAMEPSAILLDEPTSALDPDRKGEVLAVLTDLAREGTTMVVVTHEMRFARDVAHRAVALEAGRVAYDGTPAEVLGRYAG
jgi:ABC-type polar amino acid transport system ATPase subunit